MQTTKEKATAGPCTRKKAARTTCSKAETQPQAEAQPPAAKKKRRRRSGLTKAQIHRLRALPSNQIPAEKADFVNQYKKLVSKFAIDIVRKDPRKSFLEVQQVGMDELLKLGNILHANCNSSTYVYETLKYKMNGSEDGIPRVAVESKTCDRCSNDKKKPMTVTCHMWDGKHFCPVCGTLYDAPRQYSHVSLDAHMDNGDEEGLSLYDLLPSPQPSPERLAASAEIHKIVKKALLPIEEAIIFMRVDKMTLEEIGHIYSYTRERVRQYEEQAKKKLIKAFTTKQVDMPFTRNLAMAPKPKPKKKRNTPGTAGKRLPKDTHNLTLFP